MVQAVSIIIYTENTKSILLLIKYSIFQDFPCILPSPFPIKKKEKKELAAKRKSRFSVYLQNAYGLGSSNVTFYSGLTYEEHS